jgi:hypothetical protein
MTKRVHGKVRGRTIELDEDLGVTEGEEVEVQVTTLKPKKRLPGPPPGWRPGNTKTTAGRLADLCTEEDDRILEEISQDRRPETRRDIAG